MKVRSVWITLVVVAFCSVGFGAAAPGNAQPSSASSAFERLKTLVGAWQGDGSMGKVSLKYELVSGGTVLLEREEAPQMHKSPMITLYYLDGDKLALTHYCELGNQPHMVARQINLDRGEIDFDLASGAAADARHMHAQHLTLVDPNHLSSTWTLFDKSKPAMTVSAQYARVN